MGNIRKRLKIPIFSLKKKPLPIQLLKLTLIFFILKISQTRFEKLRKTISVPNFKTINFTPVIV